jgi:hypothetical protein
MHKNTPKIKQHINSQFEDSYDRVKYLKNQYEGETAYILTAGPTFKNAIKNDLKNKLKDKLVISLKQTFNDVPNLVDYHLLNFCNLAKYEYPNSNTIVGWTVWDNNQPQVIVNNFNVDFILDTFKLNDGTPNIENSISFNQSQIDLLDINNSMSRPWGPGTMYEIGIPLALYLGCKKIVTIGWDLFGNCLSDELKDDEINPPEYHYNKENSIIPQTNTVPNKKEVLKVIDCTKALYEWLNSKNVELLIVDPLEINPAYKEIKRIKSI